MQTTHLHYVSILALFLLAGCSSTAASADFSQLKTFNFVKVADTDGKAYQSLETQYLRTAVTRPTVQL